MRRKNVALCASRVCCLECRRCVRSEGACSAAGLPQPAAAKQPLQGLQRKAQDVQSDIKAAAAKALPSGVPTPGKPHHQPSHRISPCPKFGVWDLIVILSVNICCLRLRGGDWKRMRTASPSSVLPHMHSLANHWFKYQCCRHRRVPGISLYKWRYSQSSIREYGPLPKATHLFHDI